MKGTLLLNNIMSNKLNIDSEIEIDFFNEIGVEDLIGALNSANDFTLYEINENESNSIGEKNILISIKKKGGK